MTLEEYRKSINKNRSSSLSNFITKTLVTLIFVFLILIVSNFSDEVKTKIKDSLFSKTFNFSIANNIYSKFTDIFDSNKTQEVFEEIEEEQIVKYKDGVMITNNSNDVSLIYSGIVTYIGDNEDYGNTVIVQGSNGIDVWYGNIETVNVKIYDYVEMGSILGSKNESYYVVLQKNKQFLDYNETIN